MTNPRSPHSNVPSKPAVARPVDDAPRRNYSVPCISPIQHPGPSSSGASGVKHPSAVVNLGGGHKRVACQWLLLRRQMYRRLPPRTSWSVPSTVVDPCTLLPERRLSCIDPPVAVGTPPVPMVVVDLVLTPVVGIVTPVMIAAAFTMTGLILVAVAVPAKTPSRGASVVVSCPGVSVPALLTRPVKR